MVGDENDTEVEGILWRALYNMKSIWMSPFWQCVNTENADQEKRIVFSG